MLNVGFVGVGGIAQRHIRSLTDLGGTRLAAFCDVVPERAQQAARAHGGSPYTDVDRMLDSEQLDAVFVCTPPSVRAEPIMAAAARGVAVFCEKPPAFDVAQGRRALEGLRVAGVIHNVGFMYRWLDAVTRAKELLEGRPLSVIRSAFLCGPAVDMNLPAWFYLKERSGGPLLDQAIHVLDLHRYFAGDVAAVHALGNNRIRPKSDSFTIEDTYTVNLRFTSGVIGSHTHSWACRSVHTEVELVSAELRLTIDLAAGRLRGVVDGAPVQLAPDDDCYRTEVQRFLTAVERRDQSVLRSPYPDGLRSAAVTWAALTSVESGRVEAPVAI